MTGRIIISFCCSSIRIQPRNYVICRTLITFFTNTTRSHQLQMSTK